MEVQIFLKQMFRSLLNSCFLPKISFFLNKSIINVEFQIKSINESLIGPLKTFIELGAQKVLNLQLRIIDVQQLTIVYCNRQSFTYCSQKLH